MAVWKKEEEKDTPTADWFASLLKGGGFEPEELWTQGPTHLARAGGFVFRLARNHIEATGKVSAGVRVALLRRNAHSLTELYDDGLTVVFKAPDALGTFRNLLDHSDVLTEALRRRMARAYARGEEEIRKGRPLPHNEDFPFVPARSIA